MEQRTFEAVGTGDFIDDPIVAGFSDKAWPGFARLSFRRFDPRRDGNHLPGCRNQDGVAIIGREIAKRHRTVVGRIDINIRPPRRRQAASQQHETGDVFARKHQPSLFSGASRFNTLNTVILDGALA